MADSARGERAHKSSRFKALLKRTFKNDDRKDPPSSLSKAEASPARSAASSNVPARPQEINATTNAGATSTTSTNATGATDAADKPLEFEIKMVEKSVDVESDLWSRAYQKLDEKTRKWIADASKRDSDEVRVQDLINVVREREEEYKDGTPKLRIGDQEIIWRDYANRVVAWVSAIGDISINFAPAPSSVAWSAVKVLLKVRRLYITLD